MSPLRLPWLRCAVTVACSPLNRMPTDVVFLMYAVSSPDAERGGGRYDVRGSGSVVVRRCQSRSTRGPWRFLTEFLAGRVQPDPLELLIANRTNALRAREHDGTTFSDRRRSI